LPTSDGKEYLNDFADYNSHEKWIGKLERNRVRAYSSMAMSAGEISRGVVRDDR
jgi:hypothetical protein